jgi:hypothetical protein
LGSNELINIGCCRNAKGPGDRGKEKLAAEIFEEKDEMRKFTG